MRATKAVIHLDHLKDNIHGIKSFIKPGTKFCVAVKADAYGHGAVPCAKACIEAGADYLAIACVDEGIELREAGIKAPLLMLSLCSPCEVSDAVRHRITPFVFDEEYVSLFESECARQNVESYPVHIAVDSGMGRIGVFPENAGKLASFIGTCPHLFIEGTATHFAVSDENSEKSRRYTEMQVEKFKLAVKNIEAAGFSAGICHCSNSAATVDLPGVNFDMVRSGITCYGYYAGDMDRAYFERKGQVLDLNPVMTVESEICSIRDLKKGMAVGYGCTWTAEKDTKIGVIPAGYADGILRNFSSSGVQVSVGGRLYPICGRICMDQFMIDLGSAEGIKRGDRAVIFGCPSDGALMDADAVAHKTGTISYEITSCITKRVPRVYVS